MSARLLHALMAQLEDTGIALVFDAPIDLILAPESVVQPDLVLIRTANKHLVTARAIEGGVPDVVVEILSPGTRDRDLHLKHRLHERFAIPEYWIVEPDHASLEVCRMDTGR